MKEFILNTSKKYKVYLIVNKKYNACYVGMTSNLENRMQQHFKGTGSRGGCFFWKVRETYGTPKDHERLIKSSKIYVLYETSNKDMALTMEFHINSMLMHHVITYKNKIRVVSFNGNPFNNKALKRSKQNVKNCKEITNLLKN